MITCSKRAAFVLCLMAAMALATCAIADTTDTFYQFWNSSDPGAPFTIEPFDQTLGTLNGVSMLVEINVSGYAAVANPEELGLNAEFKVTLEEIAEMGWDATFASCGGYADPAWFDYDSGLWQVDLSDSGNTYRGPDTIYDNFGRFAGTEPFDLSLAIYGNAYTEGTGEVVTAYDGNARLEYWYDYTPFSEPVPEPSGLLVVLTGLPLSASLARLRRR